MEMTVGLPNCNIKITKSDEGVVCDIYLLNGERLVGTWASEQELSSGVVLTPEVPGEDNVVSFTTKSGK